MMKAYIVRHNSDGDFNESVLVYHYTEEAAQELGRGYLTQANSWEETCAERAPEHDHRCVNMTEPEQEEDGEYLRSKGWGYEDEKSCGSCGLKAYGQEEYAVCNECHQCKECGCASDGCGENCDEPCSQSEGFSCEGIKKPIEPQAAAPPPPAETEDRFNRMLKEFEVP